MKQYDGWESWMFEDSKKEICYLSLLYEGIENKILKINVKANKNEILVSRATLIINFRNNLETPGDPVGLIEDVWTHEDYRKQGLASFLLKQCLLKAKEHNCYKVNLSCADHNINFYKSLGFEVYQNNMRINL